MWVPVALFLAGWTAVSVVLGIVTGKCIAHGSKLSPYPEDADLSASLMQLGNKTREWAPPVVWPEAAKTEASKARSGQEAATGSKEQEVRVN